MKKAISIILALVMTLAVPRMRQQHSARCDFCPGGKRRGSICRAR